MRRKILIIIWPFLVVASWMQAQHYTSLRRTMVAVTGDTLSLDGGSMVPGSLRVMTPDGQVLQDSLWFSDPLGSSFHIGKEIAGADSVMLVYRVFPLDFHQTYQNKDDSLIEPEMVGYRNPFSSVYRPSGNIEEIFRLDGLNKSGSISRGISFGNSQDVVVNSNFNLQLSGKLSPDVDILAAISDNNVPVQPYGNTQLIQEFDKVFIRLDHRLMRLVAGDFVLSKPDSYFMNFNKKLQGGEFTVRTNEGNYQTRVAAALSKGKFARNRIQGVEGNQGPYKLKGAEGETFIIVLAGTEKVYIDGRLMKRGENYDYVIDYNAAEVSFTPNVLITKDKRIIVEFEYSDQRYARSLFFAGNTYEKERVKLDVHFFSEQDLKNQSLQQDLSDEEKSFLSGIGDNLEDAYVPNFDSSGFTSDQVRYRLADTTVNGTFFDSVFIYSANPDSALYRVGFSNLGQNKGNYILLRTGVNGRVYQWVAPQGGVPQGNYAPVRLLVTPKSTRMAVARADWKATDRAALSAEAAVSNHDMNTFSPADQGDNTGIALKAGITHQSLLKKSEKNTWRLNSKARLEYQGRNFEPVERYRSIEFERDWNLNDSLLENDQVMAGAAFIVSDEKLGNARYEFESFIAGDDYTGLKNILGFQVDRQGYKAYFEGNYLATSQDALNTGFLRQKAGIARDFGKVVLGVNQEQENNKMIYTAGDSLSRSSFSYFNWEAFVRSPDTATNPFHLSYKQRIDRLPKENRLDKATLAREITASMGLLKNPSNRFSIGGAYRILEIVDTAITEQEPENTIIGRVEHYLRLFKGAVTLNTYYELGSGLERKQEFYYLKVPAGEGNFMWIDYNSDGVEQLNEFEVSPFRDQAEYIRVLAQSNDFVKNYFSRFTESVNIQPAAVWKNKEGWRGVLARFSDQLVFRTDRKASKSEPALAYNPFGDKTALGDTTLISLNTSFRNTFYYNRINPKFSVDLSIQTNTSKNLLVSGSESRYQLARILNLRWNFYKPLTLLIKYDNGRRERNSEYFASSNYSILYDEIVPSLSIQPSAKLRVEIAYGYTYKLNDREDDRVSAASQNAGLEFSFRMVNKGHLLCKANYINIRYDGLLNTPLAFEMLQGFQPGRNATWGISYQQNISRFLQLNLVYDGRKGEDVSAVHTGTVQLRAHF